MVSWVALNFAFVLMLNFDFILIYSFKNNVSLIAPPTGKALELDFPNNFKLNFIKYDNCHCLVQWRINPWEMSIHHAWLSNPTNLSSYLHGCHTLQVQNIAISYMVFSIGNFYKTSSRKFLDLVIPLNPLFARGR